MRKFPTSSTPFSFFYLLQRYPVTNQKLPYLPPLFKHRITFFTKYTEILPWELRRNKYTTNTVIWTELSEWRERNLSCVFHLLFIAEAYWVEKLKQKTYFQRKYSFMALVSEWCKWFYSTLLKKLNAAGLSLRSMDMFYGKLLWSTNFIYRKIETLFYYPTVRYFEKH